MTQTFLTGVMRDGVMTMLIVCGPILIVALVVGLLISILQATTQIQEQTLTFVPKIIAVFVLLVIMFPFILSKMSDYTVEIFNNMSNMVR